MNAFDSPLVTDLELDAFVEPFESAAMHGDAPDLSDYLPEENHPRYLDALRELVRLDLEFAWDRGDCPRLESYLNRFPALVRDRHSLIEVAREEFRQRVAAGEEPDPADYSRRFGIKLFDDGLATIVVPCDRPAWSGTAMPEIGDWIPPGFVVRRELGRGAFGRVFLAEQADLASRLVAIKVSTRLVGEAQTLARLQHTNIVPIYSVHRVGDYQVLVMPFLGAATLADLLASIRSSGSLPATARDILTIASAKPPTPDAAPSEPTMPPAPLLPEIKKTETSYPRAILTIGAALADGLEHAHSRGILHRDLKPANVLLTDDGRPMLLDFNLAVDERSPSESVGGTPRYMAPEQLSSLLDGQTAVDGRADIYSLGLVLCELLTGRLPFPDRTGSWQEVVRSTRRDRESASAISHASPAIAAILRKCLAPLPDDRYQTADALREDLNRHLEDRRLKFAEEPLSRERLRKWTRRHPRLSSTSTVAALACLLLVVATWFGVTWRQQAQLATARDARDSVVETRTRVQPLVVDPNGPASQFHEARELVRIGLSPYDQATGDWTEGRLITRLPAAEVTELRSTISEMLVYQAEATAGLARAERDHQTRATLFEEALTLNERAAKAYPHSGSVHPIASQRLSLLRQAGREGEADATAKEIADALVPGNDALVRAMSALRERRYREAIDLLQPLVDSGPASYSAWMALGAARLRAGEFELAADAFLAASALDPHRHWPIFHRGVALMSANKFAAALSYFDRFLERQPHIPEARLNRAIVRFQLHDLKGAISDLHEAESSQGATARILDLRERISRREAKHGAAAELYGQLLQITPADAEGWTIRGEARLRHSPPDANGALADFDAALKLDSGHLPALKGKASCLAEHLRKQREAADVLDGILRLAPTSIEDRAAYAVLLARLGREVEARTEARKCMQHESPSLVLYQAASALALTAESPEQVAEAIELLRRTLRLDPSWAATMANDGDLKRIQKDPEFRQIIAAANVLNGRPAKSK